MAYVDYILLSLSLLVLQQKMQGQTRLNMFYFQIMLRLIISFLFCVTSDEKIHYVVVEETKKITQKP